MAAIAWCVSGGEAFASCGDWLADGHRMPGAVDTVAPWASPKNLADAPTPLRPCDSPHCRQTPVAPPPLIPGRFTLDHPESWGLLDHVGYAAPQPGHWLLVADDPPFFLQVRSRIDRPPRAA